MADSNTDPMQPECGTKKGTCPWTTACYLAGRCTGLIWAHPGSRNA